MERMIIKLGSLDNNKTNTPKECDELMTVLEKHLGDKYEIIVVPHNGYTTVDFE